MGDGQAYTKCKGRHTIPTDIVVVAVVVIWNEKQNQRRATVVHSAWNSLCFPCHTPKTHHHHQQSVVLTQLQSKSQCHTHTHSQQLEPSGRALVILRFLFFEGRWIKQTNENNVAPTKWWHKGMHTGRKIKMELYTHHTGFCFHPLTHKTITTTTTTENSHHLSHKQKRGKKQTESVRKPSFAIHPSVQPHFFALLNFVIIATTHFLSLFFFFDFSMIWCAVPGRQDFKRMNTKPQPQHNAMQWNWVKIPLLVVRTWAVLCCAFHTVTSHHRC